MYLGVNPTLVTLMGDEAEPMGAEVAQLREYMGYLPDGALDVAANYDRMGTFARQAALRQYPELLGIWPWLAKAAALVVKGGVFIGKKIADEVKYKRKQKAKKAAAQQAVQTAVVAETAQKEANKKKLLIAAAIGVPVIGLGAFMLMRRR